MDHLLKDGFNKSALWSPDSNILAVLVRFLHPTNLTLSDHIGSSPLLLSSMGRQRLNRLSIFNSTSLHQSRPKKHSSYTISNRIPSRKRRCHMVLHRYLSSLTSSASTQVPVVSTSVPAKATSFACYGPAKS